MSCSVPVHLIVIGDNPNCRIPEPPNRAAESLVAQTVLGCQPCHRTKRFQVGLMTTGTPGTLQTVVHENTSNKPAETYVLGFASESAAREWIDHNKDELCGKMILLHDENAAAA
jgi:hypothetical protein